MSNPTAAILIIGDEILSGRTRDANMHYLAGELTRIGIDLIEARFVSDRHQAIVAAVRSCSTETSSVRPTSATVVMRAATTSPAGIANVRDRRRKPRS